MRPPRLTNGGPSQVAPAACAERGRSGPAGGNILADASRPIARDHRGDAHIAALQIRGELYGLGLRLADRRRRGRSLRRSRLRASTAGSRPAGQVQRAAVGPGASRFTLCPSATTVAPGRRSARGCPRGSRRGHGARRTEPVDASAARNRERISRHCERWRRYPNASATRSASSSSTSFSAARVETRSVSVFLGRLTSASQSTLESCLSPSSGPISTWLASPLRCEYTGAQTTVEKAESMSPWRLTTTKTRDRLVSPPGWRTR